MSDNVLDIIKSAEKNKNVVKFPGKDMVEPKSAFIDPTNVLEFLGTKTKPSQISFSVLRNMAIRAKPVTAIINTRLNQVARFARRPSYDGDTGFKIVLKDPDKEPSEKELKRAKEIEEAVLNTGFIPNRKRKDNFNMFLRKLVRDSLILDAMVFENVYSRKGDLVEWWAVDGATIEMVIDMAIPNINSDIMDYFRTTVYQPVTRKGRMDEGNLAYVQRIDNQVVAEYTEDELAYAIRNPRTDVMINLYGLSELEMLVETVTNILNAESYNSGYFSQSNLPQGILEIVGKYEDEHLEAFKRAWEALVSGSVGKWKVPIMALEEGQGLKFHPFKKDNKEMEFAKWLEFLTSIACAIYQIDPAEIGLKPWSGSKGSGMIESDAEATRIDASKDKGFFPLMQFLAETFNFEVINRIDPDYQFEWVGLNEEDTARKEKQRSDRLSSGFSTVDEERQNEDKPTIYHMLVEHGIPDEEAKIIGSWGLAPANTTLMQAYTAATGQLQQQKMAEQGNQEEEQLFDQAGIKPEDKAVMKLQKNGVPIGEENSPDFKRTEGSTPKIDEKGGKKVNKGKKEEAEKGITIDIFLDD